MDIKKDIEFLESMKPSKCLGMKLQGYEIDKINTYKIDEIIKRLQMWEKFKMKYGIRFTKLPSSADLDKLYALMNIFEQNYFSKRINRIIEVEVEASNMEVINELAKDIEEMNGRSFDKGKIGVVSTRWVRD